MSYGALLLVTLASGQVPDALDHLRAGDVVPQVGLLLDRSCSMGNGAVTTECRWYADTYKSGNTSLDKNDQMKAVLTGCKSADDGILDLWADRVNFSIYEFGSSVLLNSAFGSDLATLEAGVLGIPHSGATYLTRGLREHGKYFSTYFTDDNTLQCRPNFLVVLSDGNPNGGSGTFDYECTAPVESRSVSSSQPWLGADYLYRHDDILCSVPGDQSIRTYSIGFGAPGSFSPSNLQNIAAYGGGEYYYAADAANLSVAFENVINSIVARSALFYAPIAIQTGSMFSDNYGYSASFRPEAGGPWHGTLKRYCIAPPIGSDGLYDADVDTCIFKAAADRRELVTNPEAMDLWTGSRALAADEGGAGAVLLSRMGVAAGGAPVSPYWTHRNIVTYRPGETDYTTVDPSSWTAEDAFANGCDYHRLMNHLHGYTYDADCVTGNPVSASRWPLGDPIHATPQLLKYGACEDEDDVPIPGNCYVVAAMNDGMVHFFDAADGDEKTALIPGELWEPGPFTTHVIRDVDDQPTANYTHRYYVDGDTRVFHEDTNADGIIQSTETAYLLFGLGRGGRMSYLMPVSELPDGVLTAEKNPVVPLRPEPGTALADIQETWAAPWVGLAPVDGTTKRVAVFASGHVARLDLTDGDPVPPEEPEPLDLDNPEEVNCEGENGFARFNGFNSDWCSRYWNNGCQGNASKPCYDASATPLDISSAPMSFDDGEFRPGAIRVEFNQFEIDPNDVLRIEDGDGNLVGDYTEDDLYRTWTPWIYDDQVVIRLITDGTDTRHKGFRLDRIQWAPGERIEDAADDAAEDAAPALPPFTLGVDHKPSIFVMDLDRFNGATRTAFASATTDDGMLLRFTNDCEDQAEGRCFDADDHPDLANMVCPISAEVSVFTENQHLKAIYVGDECAQIWKVATDDFGRTWTAERLINLNGGALAVDRNHRKIFRKIDIVLSRCLGGRAVGLYFGTGDVQRPTDKDGLADLAVTSGRDLIGVLFDRADTPRNLTEEALKDVTEIPDVDPLQLLSDDKQGWMIQLQDNEKMLRDPLVFDRVAYYKTFEPTDEAAECRGGSGIDRIYAINSCSAEPAQEGSGQRTVGEREVWNGHTEIGGGLFFFTPRDAPVLVSHADITTQSDARLNQRRRVRPGLFYWRER